MTDYTIVRIYSSENARYEGTLLSLAVESYIRSLKIAARCVVLRGTSGFYESGEAATTRIVELSYNLPIVIEIVLPAEESPRVLERLEAMVADGIVATIPATVSFHAAGALFPRNLRVGDVMTRKPVAVHPDFPVRAAVELLLDNRLKSLPVVDIEGRCVGILTQNDLVSRAGMPMRLGMLSLLPNEVRDRWLERAEGLRCEEAMTRDPRTVLESSRLADAIGLMSRESRKRLPVLDERSLLVGMLSRIDVLRAVAATRDSREEPSGPSKGSAAPRFVRDVEAREDFSLREDCTVKAAIDGLVRSGLQRAAIVDARGRLVGLVTDEILVRALAAPARRFPAFGRLRRMRINAGPVSSIMRRDIKTVGEDMPIGEAIRLMTEVGLKRIPVTDAEGIFRGMIRRDSILMAISSSVQPS